MKYKEIVKLGIGDEIIGMVQDGISLEDITNILFKKYNIHIYPMAIYRYLKHNNIDTLHGNTLYNGYKYCFKCKCVYPTIMYYTSKSTADGYYCWCIDCVDKERKFNNENMSEYDKECRRKHSKEVYWSNPEKVRLKSRNYKKTKKGKLVSLKSYYTHEGKGFIPLMDNPYPEEVEIEWHHISPELSFVVPMPRITHRYTLGNGHFTHNLNWIKLLKII